MFCPKCGGSNSPDANFCVSCGVQFTTAIRQSALQNISAVTLTKNAGFWLRVFASIIDSILCQLASMVILLPIGFALGVMMASTSTMDEVEAAGAGLGFILGIVIQWLWFTLAESSKWQASLGKKLLGLKVTDENGNRISFGRANGRYWGKALSFITFFIGFLMVAFTKKKQGLHDVIAGTLVVRVNS